MQSCVSKLSQGIAGLAALAACKTGTDAVAGEASDGRSASAALLTLEQTLPAGGRLFWVEQNNAASSDEGDGSKSHPFKTIGAAAKLAKAGDTVIVRAGTYRERVTPGCGGEEGKPVVYMAAPGETVVVKGSDLWTPAWKIIADATSVYEAEFDPRLFKERSPYRIGISVASKDQDETVRPADGQSLKRTLGQLFVDGVPYIQAEEVESVRSSPGTWIVSASGNSIIAHFPDGVEPGTRVIELTVRDRVFAPRKRGLGFIQVKGFIFEHCANQGPFPQGGAVSVRSGHHWLLEGNTIRFATTIGLDCGSEFWDCKQLRDTDEADQKLIVAHHNIIRGNIISDNGLCGIAGWNHGNTVIFRNTIERNNSLNFYTWFDAKWEEWGGIKLHGTNALIEGNLIRDNEGHGVWIDNGYENARITRNVILNNRMTGVFMEYGAAPCLIDNNIVAFTRAFGYVDRSGGDYFNGIGLHAHDASNLIAVHNLFASNAGSVRLMRTVTDRAKGTTNERIYNNVFYDNGGVAVCLPYPSARAKGNISDYNVILAKFPGALFEVNECKEVPPGKEVVAALEAKLKTGGVPPEEWPNLAQWPRHPVLDLPQWRLLMGLDEHSRELFGYLDAKDAQHCQAEQFSILLRPRLPNMTINATDAFLEATALDVDIVDHDFMGDAMPAGHRRPGPFQNLKPGRNTITLWPLRGEYDTTTRDFGKSTVAKGWK